MTKVHRLKPSYARQALQKIIKSLKEKPAVSLFIRVAREMGRDNAGDMAGTIAYYAILSIFPLLLGVIALLGFFLPSESIQAQIFQFSNQYVPGANQLIQRNISSIIELRGALGLFSIAGLFWTGSAIFGAIGRVINRAWDIHTYRPFYIRKLRDIAIAVATSFIFFISMTATALSSIIPVLDLPVLDSLATITSRLVGFVLVFAMLLLIYKYMPNAKTSWSHVWPGAFLAAFLFETARSVFTIYLNNFASYDMVYGSVATVIVFLVWVYLSAFIVIIGAEFASEYGRMHQNLKRAKPATTVREKA